MRDQLFIFTLIFGAVLFVSQAASWWFVHARSQQRAINRRLELYTKFDDSTDVVAALRRERGFSDFASPWMTALNDYLVQTGLTIEYGKISLYISAIAVAVFIVLSAFLGLGLLTAMIAICLTVCGSAIVVSQLRRRRINRFADQLPDALDVIVRGVKVGHPLSTALNLVAKEMPDPAGSEFGVTSDEVGFGLSLEKAIENLTRRVGQEDLLFFATAVNIQNKTGGNLADILARLSQLIRQRAKIRLKIKALTAEGRLSAIFLTVVPFIIFALLNFLAPTYYGEVRSHPATQPVFIGALVLLMIGNVIIRRMVQFRG